ncbi:hypothetical protein COW36_20855 [bacterium (Candidatus Blackallbacteria) CG17_big_fil_post_rev_8_21_14_2_50_48_46]|uniref:Uncharacterized protein n=1 Tax=bacterium (Candidatus Blackallbacteria) CG17_big_fil_post_rev_8_21_14_2_50_48_46 TaxID=2014261 RepID=A0A2M7FYP4_9BACT|nr:MAG: hypothetical protein COW64_14165 [bacterium (Candidatus Blackallbacteria) CG18_big_fil_WC_8_21_14_2_50_49_26]PIW14493.1 MAG: hypothetical protein COW36_20855 [bacterium (Candidatus Blackallbacteria) CG17_big_fil_post_rev_8_21_14_2_50_48_46]PIW47179.1 MAG: hypothetical protein COW20_13300 [bacterium (Candidatus Blackallbacteria) CG13_big_fil_rev_8_21_14_2_50_49_14]
MEITPVRIEASGMGVFEKTETVETQVPENTGSEKAGASPCAQDSLKLTKKMRRQLEKKVSRFKQAVISPAEQQQREKVAQPQHPKFRAQA